MQRKNYCIIPKIKLTKEKKREICVFVKEEDSSTHLPIGLVLHFFFVFFFPKNKNSFLL